MNPKRTFFVLHLAILALVIALAEYRVRRTTAMAKNLSGEYRQAVAAYNSAVELNKQSRETFDKASAVLNQADHDRDQALALLLKAQGIFEQANRLCGTAQATPSAAVLQILYTDRHRSQITAK